MLSAQRLLRSRTPTRYQIGANEITLPEGHKLPDYQAAHRLYDRFLPVLCARLPPGLIVDVGANVGDTVAAILPTCANPIIAIEGYGPFYDLLVRNLVEIDPAKRVSAMRAIIGTGQRAGDLTENNGTARIQSGPPMAQIEALDDVLPGEPAPVLVKVDTDGSDADVLLSGLPAIRASEPLLYWEGGTDEMSQFGDLYAALRQIGYHTCSVFDNFGNLLLGELSISSLPDLDHYVSSQYRLGCSRSVYYFDILAWTSKHSTIAYSAVAAYRDVIGDPASTRS